MSVHAWQALLLQSLQLSAVPWILALFLLGYAVGRAGLLSNIRSHRLLLKGGACLGLALGLPANIGLGIGGPLAGWGPSADGEPRWVSSGKR